MVPLWGYLAVTVPLVLTPGASTAVVLRNSVEGGTRAGVITAIGINSGSLCWGLLTAFGFAVAVQHYPGAWSVLRAGGVAYLAWLGVQSLRKAAALHAGMPIAEQVRATQGAWHNLYEGFVTNLLNPALATFYLVLLPQFIPRGAPVVQTALTLTAVHIALAISWHLAWAFAGGTLARALAGGRPRQALEIVAGVALIALAVKIALS
ncbi:MAG TPA: LysE family translocator [Vicinamibacterales bacterium]